jgi:hypothetical protein
MSSRDTDIGSTWVDPASTRHDIDPRSESEAYAGNANHSRNGQPSSSTGPNFAVGSGNPRKRTSASTDISGDETRTEEARNGARPKERTAHRAAQACLRCRRQKLRCLGGNPCERCVRTSNECSFGHSGSKAHQGTSDVVTTEVVAARAIEAEPEPAPDREREERLKLLETSVANLLAGLAEEPDLAVQGYPNLEIFHEVVKHRSAPSRVEPSSQPSTQTRLPPPTHVRPIDPIRIGSVPVHPVISPSSSRQGHHSISPAMLFDNSPNDPAIQAPRSLDTMLNPSTTSRADKDRHLPSTATESLYEAPFRSLVRHVSCI